ncbi:unnamed protein product [Protopolystoma xenopodis]|uniref:Uncharacterized protein n=1 Tax=Protopolystoma xenopodis TaxID=117903 RepID=A0A448WAR0_9PLAT|nr:unnamed protein product [Protopolystoma xenopodis]
MCEFLPFAFDYQVEKARHILNLREKLAELGHVDQLNKLDVQILRHRRRVFQRHRRMRRGNRRGGQRNQRGTANATSRRLHPCRHKVPEVGAYIDMEASGDESRDRRQQAPELAQNRQTDQKHLNAARRTGFGPNGQTRAQPDGEASPSTELDGFADQSADGKKLFRRRVLRKRNIRTDVQQNLSEG